MEASISLKGGSSTTSWRTWRGSTRSAYRLPYLYLNHITHHDKSIVSNRVERGETWININFGSRQYKFKKNERIMAMFNEFDDVLSEEAMWQVSESIKPRGGRRAPPQPAHQPHAHAQPVWILASRCLPAYVDLCSPLNKLQLATLLL